MTTQEFIKNTYNTPSNRERRCSSVFTDNHGNVYSYGYHYPLAFHIEGLDFVNAAGYSSSTSKHIAWARRAVPGAIEVELPSRGSWAGIINYSLGDMLAVLRGMRDEIEAQMRTKKRKDTQVYAHLQYQYDCIVQDMHKVRASL